MAMDGNGTSRSLNHIVVAVCCALTIAQSGCGDPEAIAPGELLPSPALDLPLNIPDASKLRVPISRGQLDKLDFMTLGGCDLQKTLGKYQSSLGRGASASQRLLLDLEYLRLAAQCIDHKHKLGDSELSAFLASVADIKQNQLPATIFNATLGSAEFQHFWRKRAAFNNQPEQQQLTLSALQAINVLTSRWLAGDYRASNITFEIYLSEIANVAIGPHAQYSRETRSNITQLEQQLAAVLPPAYRAWQEYRRHYLARLEPSMKLD